MFPQLIQWITSLWKNTIDPTIEQMAWDDYEYLKTKYGIQQPFVDEDEDDAWTE